MENSHKVIGHYGMTDSQNYLTSEQGGLLISDTQESLREYYEKFNLSTALLIKKIRGTDLLKAHKEGKAISLNKTTYNRFYPIAIAHGIKLEAPESMPFDEKEKEGLAYITLFL